MNSQKNSSLIAKDRKCLQIKQNASACQPLSKSGKFGVLFEKKSYQHLNL